MPPDQNERATKLVTLAIFLQVLLAALDTTIVSTAMPTVVAALGGLNLYSGVFSAYLIASTIATPIAGKLSDQFNRKNMYLASIVAFLATSMLCGVARNMVWLIVCRALQGLAGGTMFAISLSLVGVIYPPHQRGKIQGFISSLWAIASMIGPPLGGYVVQHFSWRWAFYLNLPIGILAMVFIHRFLHDSAHTHKHVKVDYAGAALLAVAVTGVMILSNNLETISRTVLLAALGAIAVLLFGLWHLERKAGAPIVPLTLLRQSDIAAANLTTFIMGVCAFSLIVFAPLFVQGVLSGTATQAGLVLLPFSIGWGLGSFGSGHFVNRFSYRVIAMSGVLFMVAGFGYQTLFLHTASFFQLATVGFFIGIGMGMATNAITVAVQNTAPPDQLGTATASTIFSRALGAAIGVSILGAVLAHRVAANVGGPAANGGLVEVRTLLLPETRAQISTDVLAHLQTGLADGLHFIFGICCVLAVITFFVAMRVSALRPEVEIKSANPVIQ